MHGYYPGCSLRETAKEYDISTRLVCNGLGLELREIEDWNCCGASPGHQSSDLVASALPYRNLALAQKQNLKDIVAPCAECYSRLKAGQHEAGKDGKAAGLLAEIVELPYSNGSIEVKHIVDLLRKDLGAGEIAKKVKKPLKGLKAACYYGCLLVRPKEYARVADPDDPQSMDEIVAACGATPVEWSHKTECCGASQILPSRDAALRLNHEILSAAEQAGAEVLVVGCPMCKTNTEMYQKDINKRHGSRHDMPVLYITQLVGLALGFGYDELGLNYHAVPARELLSGKGFI